MSHEHNKFVNFPNLFASAVLPLSNHFLPVNCCVVFSVA